MLKCITPHNAHCIISTIIHQISTIFKTIDDETSLSGQKIVSVLQARKIAQQQATTQLETDIACLKQYEIACQSGSVSTEQFDSIMKKASVSATEYSSKIKEGTGSAQSYASAQKANNAALQSVGTGAGIASKAVKALSATMNTIAITAIFTLISKGISWVSEQIDDYIHRNEIAIEKAEELLDTFETEVNTITSNQDKISGYADEFEELSKGVDNLGRNVSLTASEYSKYQSIVKEIVGINPSLIQGYDEENNILANKNGLIETSIQLLKDEYNQKLKNLALPDNIDTALGGAVGRYNTAKEDFLEVEIPATLAWSGVKIDEDGNRETGYVNQISQYIEDVIGVEFTGWEGGINQYILDNAEAVFDNLDKIKERAAETKDGWEGLNDSQLIDLMDYFKELRIAYNDMNTASTSANPTLQYVAMAEDAYSQLSDTQKQMVSEYINGIKITSETTEQEKENIRKSIISLVQDLSDIDNTDVQNAITSLYAPQDEEETVETYKARIEAAIQTIKNYCEENGIEIPIDFDSKTSSVDKMVNNVKGKLKGTEFDEKVGELNLGDLQIAAEQVDVPLDSIESWEELLALIQKVKDETFNNETTISDAFALKTSSGDATALSNLKDQLSEVQTAYQTCLSAKEEYDAQGYLSIETLEKVLSLGEEYLQYLFDEQGNVKLDAEAFQNLALARINAMEAEALSNLAKDIEQITNEATATDYLAKKQNELANSYTDVAASALLALKTIDGYSDSESLQGAYDSLKSRYEQIKGLFTSTKQGLGASLSGKSDATYTIKDQISAYMDFQKKLLEVGKIDCQTYGSTVSNYLKNMWNSGKISAKEYYDYTGEMLENQKDYYDDVLAAVIARYDREIDKIQKTIDSIEEQNDALQKQLDMYDSALDAIQDLIDSEKELRQDQIDGIEKENDALQKEIDDYDKLLNAVTLVVDEKRESIEAEQKAIDDRIEALQKENDEYQKQLELEQAKDALLKARQQRTKYIYSGENRGFIYDTDADAISEAEKNLSDLTFQATINALEEEKELLSDILEQLDEVEKAWQDTADVWDNNKAKSTAEEIFGSNYKDIILNADPEAIAAITQGYVNANQKLENNQTTIEAIEAEIDELDKLGDKWNEIASEHEKAIDRENAATLLGAEWERIVLEDRQVNFEEFKNNYLTIQGQIEDNTSLIESYEEKISYYEKLKAEWEAITDKIEEENQDRLIAEQFGVDGEKKILDGRKEILEDFKIEYCRIQDELAVAAEESARRQLEAAKKAASIPDTPDTPIYSIVDNSGKVTKDGFTDLQEAGKALDELNKTARGTNKRYHIETHHTGLDSGYVGNGFRALSDDERLGILRRASINGLKQNEVPAILERGELVLTEEQIKGISNSLVMPNYNGLLSGLTNIPKTVSPISNINQTFNITCPGITSQEVMNNLTRELQKLPLQMYQSSFKK